MTTGLGTGSAPNGAVRRWSGFGGNREVPPLSVRARCAASLEEEGGSRGKPDRSPRATKWTAWMPGTQEDA
jgi:hypothetical protein